MLSPTYEEGRVAHGTDRLIRFPTRRDGADQKSFEADREKMLLHGISIGMIIEEFFKITDPDMILGLWTAAVAKDA